MQLLTALLHTHNDALRLGRALETLYACDQIVIIDHGSRDATVRIARQYGSRIVSADASASSHFAAVDLDLVGGWLLCLTPHESLSESLATSLFELKANSSVKPGAETPRSAPAPYAVFLREETPGGWIDHPTAQTRLVPYGWSAWSNNLPVHDPSAEKLAGELLRFELP
jgi:hypothetical protein